MDTHCVFDRRQSQVIDCALTSISNWPDIESQIFNLQQVARVAFKTKPLLPDLGYCKKIENAQITHIPTQAYVNKWIEKYVKAFENRPSVRVGKPSGTVPDPVVKFVFGLSTGQTNARKLDQYEQAHSRFMTIENLVGDLLEEYLSEQLLDSGWYCCWGSTLKSVDFCKATPRIDLLQIKTSDNSENSSSSKIRKGTKIKKWFRRVSRKSGVYNWDELKSITQCNTLDETSFRSFCARVLHSNPSCVYKVDSANKGD